ncbi:hypothetical protein ACQQ4G_003144 [Listeria monocytogenes]
MDLLFKRYASPFPLLDLMIQSNRFDEFVTTMVDEVQEEKIWELYLHYRWLEKSFNEFKRDVLEQPANQSANEKMTEKEIGATIKNSRNMLNGFNPYE